MSIISQSSSICKGKGEDSHKCMWLCLILQIYNKLKPMQATKEQIHQVWLQCMQMNQCTPQVALAFLAQVHPVINSPLSPSKQTLLMLAASISSINLVKATLSYKPNVALKDSIGRTALHYSAAVGCIQIFELLIKYGCSPDEQTIGGQTPLCKACAFAQGDIIQWYLNNNLPAFQIADKMGRKPLEILKTGGQLLYDQVRQVYEQLRGDTAMRE